MSISISYASRRSEVWQWYWQAWRRRLWKTHGLVFFAALLAAMFALYGGLPKRAEEWEIVVLIGLLPLAAFAIFPMIKFKPQTRTLTIDQSGIDTTIGKISATVPWDDIAEVREDQGKIIIQRRNLNAFIIPARAFDTTQACSEFRDFVQAMVPAKGR